MDEQLEKAGRTDCTCHSAADCAVMHLMRLPLHIVDAFTSRLFRGNPAAVIPLPYWLDDATLQSIAQENNLSETAFLVAEAPGCYALRWFTPQVEIALCGHATLASAWVLFQGADSGRSRLSFSTRSGLLEVSRLPDGKLQLDFPAQPPRQTVAPSGLAEALGAAPREVWQGGPNWLAVYETAEQVQALQPDLAELNRVPPGRVIVTAPGRDADFVSRFFAPGVGIPEDPVTGSAHCVLTPFWAARLGRNAFFARQLSARGGELWCELAGDRVRIAGYAVPYLQGTIALD